MKTLKGRWKVRRALSMLLVCTMFFSNVELPVFAAEPSAEVMQQENTPEQPEETGTETPEQSEEEPETETPGQPEETEQQENPGVEDSDGQMANPGENGDEEQSEDLGTEHDGEQAGEPETLDENDHTDKVEAKEILYSGTTNNISWKIDQGGELTIEGTGDYECTYALDSYVNLPPWCEYFFSHATVKVTGMTTARDMFSECYSLRTVDLEDFDTSNITDMSNMFNRCWALTTVDLSGLNTSNVTNMSDMFFNCSSLEAVDLSGLNTSNVTNMGSMFCGCEKLETLDGLDGFDTCNVIDVSFMFSDCKMLDSLDMSGWDLSKVGVDASYRREFLTGCDSLKYIRTPKKPSVEAIGLPISADAGKWYDDEGVLYTKLPTAGTGENKSITLTRKKLNAGKINDISWEIDENGRLTISGSGDYGGWESGEKRTPWIPWSNRSDVLSAVVNVSGIHSTDAMFYGCSKLSNIDLSGLDTSEVTDMSYMFSGCSSLETLNLNGLDTGNVAGMSSMFEGCSSLETLNLNSLDTSNVVDMSSMFRDCGSLRTLNLNRLDTGNVASMWCMFYGCSSLETLNLDGMALGVDMMYMFYECSSLKTLNLDVIENKNSIDNMRDMFFGCSKLQSLDLSRFDLGNEWVLGGSLRIGGCRSLSYIKTPRNCNWEEALPDGDKWYDKNGTEYTQLPRDLTESIDLYRGGESGGGQKQYVYVSGVTVASRPYDGNALAYAGTAGVTDADGNTVSGVTLTASYTGTLADGSEYTITDQAPSQAGNYKLSFAITGAGEESYILRNSVYNFQISKRQVTITAPDRVIALGGQLPDLSAVDDYTVDGFLTGDQLLKEPVFRYGEKDIATQKPGSYEIIPYGAKADANYRIKYVRGQLTVGEENGYDLSEAEILFSDIKYDGQAHEVNPVVRYREWTLAKGIDYKLETTRVGSGAGSYSSVIYAGEYCIRITGIGFYYGEQTKTFRVVYGSDMDFGDILPDDLPYDGRIPDGLWIAGVSEYGYMYTGKAIKPAVRVYDHKTLLKEKTDYTISYANNVKANATPEGDFLDNVSATPTITVTGKGNYSGTTKEYFAILQNDISPCGAGGWYTSAVTVAYTGKPQKPQPVFMTEWDRSAQLKSGNYTVAYYRAEDVQRVEPLNAVQEEGEYVIQCTGKGNYAGVAECPLTVTKLKVVGKLKVSKIPNQPYTGDEICPSVTVKDGSTTLTKDVHYYIGYNYNTEVGTGEVWISGIPEAGYAGERRVTFKITGTPIKKAAVTGLATSVYSGTQHKPEPVLTMKKTVNGAQTTETLQKDCDYTLSWQKNENAGTATVVITGIGGYTGTMKKTFKIGKYDIARNEGGKLTAGLEEAAFPYEKGGVKAKPVVIFHVDDGSQLTLTEGKDYTLSYKQHTGLTKDGKYAEITIKGKGNFSGAYQNKLHYEIVRQDIGRLTLTAQDKVYQNKKNIYATKVTVTDVNGKILKAGADYDKAITYTYANPTEVQDAAANGAAVNRSAGDTVEKNDVIPAGTVLKVKAAAKEGGSYSGALEGEYRITQASIASAAVSVPKQTYTGQPVTLEKSDITVKIKGKPVADDQWEIVPDSYKNNVKKGTASVTIRGVDNYGGTKTIKFAIKAKAFAW